MSVIGVALHRFGAEAARRGAAAASARMHADRRAARIGCLARTAADRRAGQSTLAQFAAVWARLGKANSAMGRDSVNGPQRAQP